MGLKMKKKKKTNRETWQYATSMPANPAVVGSSRFDGGTAGIAKAVNYNKAAQCQLKELKRHNCHGVYFAPYKRGRGVSKKKNVKETLRMPKDVTTNVQLHQLAERMRISYFRGVFMRTILPTGGGGGVRRNESGIVNLNNTEGPDTH